MPNKRTAFFIRAYNDLDHFSPVIWEFIKKDDKPIVIFHTDLDYENDYRVNFLKSEGEIDIYRFLDESYVKNQKNDGNLLSKINRRIYNLKRNPNRFFGRLHRLLFFNCSKEIDFLKENNISQCVFEWAHPYARGEKIEKFFKAAKGLGVTTYCIPHGCNIYINSDVNIGYSNSIKKGRIPDQKRRDEYDYYIFQNLIRRDGFVKWGLSPYKTQAWGSARFYPEWQKINLEICPPIKIRKDNQKRLKVVFMDHQRDYNVHVNKIWSLLDKIATNDQIFLVIKQSTRAGKDYHSKIFRDKYKNAANVEFVGNEYHSPKLIEWSDLVINFGSSIGIEVLMQNKLLVNPYYLHSNETLFEKFDAAFNAKNDKEVIHCLEQLIQGKSPKISISNKQELYKEVIFGGKQEYNVLHKYFNEITGSYLSY